ncbi:hypothetical protein PREVCOP_05342 [Segatella copri DSM 18205]|uniref:MATE efflux family protein n=1 Tax=Segatella copri DSM 18205 TaxID=537011 RepID=D1PDQ2_9BACT|nr:hypothetical protein PREVCOP_05342 [Segatella copri DSM 18205]
MRSNKECILLFYISRITKTNHKVQWSKLKVQISMLSGVMEMIARCGVSLWLVPALAWTGVCFGDPVAWIMADLFLIPAFLWLYKHLKKESEFQQPFP